MSEFFKDFDCSIKNNAYEYLGSFLSGDSATFRVWAPNAKSVSVKPKTVSLYVGERAKIKASVTGVVYCPG